VAQLSPPETASQKSSSSESPIKTPVKRKLKEDSEEESVESSKDVKPVLNWVLDSKFKREQARLKIPEAAIEWTQAHVTHWLEWAIKQFELRGINMSDWHLFLPSWNPTKTSWISASKARVSSRSTCRSKPYGNASI